MSESPEESPDRSRESLPTTIPRVNGWECPWHPLQVLSWGVVLFFVLMHYGFTVFYFPSYWRIIGYVFPGILLVVHVLSTVVTTTIDPAEVNLRRKLRSGGIISGVFDRRQHEHVIEDLHCHICEVDVHTSAKHCKVCDKCINGFDHHCKWLNTCIGTRNYRWFLVSISSGLISTILNFLLSLIFFILFFSDRSLIRYSCDQPFNVTGCDDVLRLFGAQVPDPIFPTIHSIIVLVSAVATLLLGHLVLFHCFIIYKGMTTYDYILQQRSIQSTDSSHSSCLYRNRVTPLLEDGGHSKVTESTSTSSSSSAGKMTFGRTPPPSEDDDKEDYTITANEEYADLANNQSKSPDNGNHDDNQQITPTRLIEQSTPHDQELKALQPVPLSNGRGSVPNDRIYLLNEGRSSQTADHNYDIELLPDTITH